ncbi:uncharacterized protein J4E88_009424 [Alternaria novae-zelandiae]|uniref:uncharacterized protein n=1 Tax=Alternaria novae-zelandiae TaxID=430562 RepID=UPI0020C2315D|nr:uncharacterized protein J4E88_009424 [Alternaria novae-zelandiae]KAI4671029.1 hypothetical protein J4E88_009424 [Alternaria novae-zelandiae]
MKYTTPLILFIAALTTANPVTSPSANAITSATPLVARDPICDKCNKEFEDCQKPPPSPPPTPAPSPPPSPPPKRPYRPSKSPPATSAKINSSTAFV